MPATNGSLARKGAQLLAATSLLLAAPARADNHGGADLLKNAGQFTAEVDGALAIDSLEAKKWFVVSPDSYDFKETGGHLELRKHSVEDGTEGFFDDGITYLFLDDAGELMDYQPKHIHFEIKTDTPGDMESCDLRFYEVEKVKSKSLRRLDNHGGGGEEDPEPEDPNADGEEEEEESSSVTAAPSGPSKEYKKKEFSDIALFRLGFFDYMKLNTQNMLKKYEGDSWYRVDLILNFDEQRVSAYVNEKPLKSSSFFTQRKDKLVSGNALSLYGLSPGSVSYFKNIRMCNTVCPTHQEYGFSDLSGATAGFGSAAGLFVGVSALLMSLLA